jgi:hypothetical protein
MGALTDGGSRQQEPRNQQNVQLGRLCGSENQFTV